MATGATGADRKEGGPSPCPFGRSPSRSAPPGGATDHDPELQQGLDHGHEYTTSGFIGQSIQINGELTGNEDLVIDGRVEGKIDLSDHNLTVGENGNIQADIHAKAVTVKGQGAG